MDKLSAISPVQSQTRALRLMKEYLDPAHIQQKMGAAQELTKTAVEAGLVGDWTTLGICGGAAHQAGIVPARDLLARVAEEYLRDELTNEQTLETIAKIGAGKLNSNTMIFTLGGKLPGVTWSYLNTYGQRFVAHTIAEQLLVLSRKEPGLQALLEPAKVAMLEQVEAKRESDIREGKATPPASPLELQHITAHRCGLGCMPELP